MSKADYSEWLVQGTRLAEAEQGWATMDIYSRAIALLAKNQDIPTSSFLEFGCGTGWMALALRQAGAVSYFGLDALAECLAQAEQKNPVEGFNFVQGDFRAYEWPTSDTAVALAFLKHFSLAEWDSLFLNFLRSAEKSVLFTMSVSTPARDDNFEFPHVWVPLPRILVLLQRAGFPIHEWEIFSGEGTKNPEILFYAKKDPEALKYL